MTKNKREKIVELLSDIGMDVSPDELKDVNSVDDLTDYLQDNDYFNIEIIYYSRAMEYLLENDPSLQLSLELADDMGYEVKNLNSETLASILASENIREEYYDRQSELEEIFE